MDINRFGVGKNVNGKAYVKNTDGYHVVNSLLQNETEAKIQTFTYCPKSTLKVSIIYMYSVCSPY